MSQQVEKLPVARHLKIYLTLVALQGISLGLAFLPVGRWMSACNYGIALLQVSLIWIFYMHLRSARPVTRYFSLLGIAWLCILVTLTLSDYVSRNWMLFPAKWPVQMELRPLIGSPR